MVPTLQAVKAHLRVDGDDEDALIQGYLDAAIGSVESFTERTFSGFGAEAMPPAVAQAVLLLVGHFYEHREAVSDKQTAVVPMAFEYLLWPHRASVPM